jgi:hypothetical protein
MKLVESLLRRFRQVPIVDAWVYRYGPASRTIPKSLRHRVVRQSAIPRLDSATSWRFGTSEIVKPRPPTTVGGRTTLSPLALRPHPLPPPFVAELRDASLVGVHAVPFTREGAMLLTGFRDALPLLALEAHPELEEWTRGDEPLPELSPDLESALSANPVCPLVGRFDTNYFHWLVDMCGQLEGLRAYSHATLLEPTILVRAAAPAFVRESLALLGYEPGSVLEWPLEWSPTREPSVQDMLVATVPRLVISAWRGYRHGSSSRSLIWLRNAFLNCVGNARLYETTRDNSLSSGTKIYVRRDRAAWRTIHNERDVQDLLSARGFVTLRPEQLSIRDQVTLFARASIIVGMHGAGLANVLFAPKARLVELVGGYGGPEYFSMCHGLGNTYTRVQCDIDGENIHVDLRLLDSAVGAP